MAHAARLARPAPGAFWPYVVYPLVSIYFCWPLYAQPHGLGMMDWDQHFFYYGSVLKSVAGFTQLPFWNPWYCGGNVMWQNPQIALLSPVYLLAAVVSLPVAMKATITAHYLASFIGMHLMVTRVFRVTFFPIVLFLSCLYTLSGAPALHVAVGHSTFMTFLLLPLALYFTLRAIEGGALRHGLLAGGVIALAIYNGGVYAVALAGVAFAAFAILGAAIQRRFRPLTMMAVIGAAAFLYGAPKLLPIGLYLASPQYQDVRVINTDTLTWEETIGALVDPIRPAGFLGWFEVGNYLGFVGGLVVAASLASILLGPWRRERWLALSLAVVAVLVLLLTRGPFSHYSPFALLGRLPLLSSLRNPSRYTLVFGLCAAAASAAAVQLALAGMTLTTGAKRLVGTVLMLAAFEQASHNRRYFVEAMIAPVLDPHAKLFARGGAPPLDMTSPSQGPDSPLVRAIAEDRDLVNCYEPLMVKRGIVPARDLVSSDPSVKFFSTTFSPNRIAFTALTGGDEARVYLNQNYIEGWHSSAGPVRLDPAVGLGYVTLPKAFAGRVTFSFRPPGLYVGLMLFVVGAVLSRSLWRKAI